MTTIILSVLVVVLSVIVLAFHRKVQDQTKELKRLRTYWNEEVDTGKEVARMFQAACSEMRTEQKEVERLRDELSQLHHKYFEVRREKENISREKLSLEETCSRLREGYAVA